MTQQIPAATQPAENDDLTQIAASIVRDQRRIMQIPTPSAANAMAEISGTVLAYQRDVAEHMYKFEQWVVSSMSELFAAVEDVQQAATGTDAGTQFDPEDAEKFEGFITTSKSLAEATRDAPGQTQVVKEQCQRLIALADELLSVIAENTLEDDGDEAEAEEAEAEA
jgi:uncharacterized protein YegL